MHGKKASVTPIFKNGTRVKVENYRPISLTSICCKILEKLVRKNLLKHMVDNGFLSTINTVLFSAHHVLLNYFKCLTNSPKYLIKEEH